jgi:hypothetical protein
MVRRNRKRTLTVIHRTLSAVAALAVFSALPAQAGALPDSIWSGDEGCPPSITADARGDVSVTLPAQAVADAGGGSVAQIVKDFLETYGAHICSAAFDFQAAHARLKVGVALMRPVNSAGLPGQLYETQPTYREVVIDYTPRDKVTCVAPAPFVS